MSIADQVLSLEQENEQLRAENEQLKSQPQQHNDTEAIDKLLDLIQPDIEMQERLILHEGSRLIEVIAAYRQIRPNRRRGNRIERS